MLSTQNRPVIIMIGLPKTEPNWAKRKLIRHANKMIKFTSW